MAMGNLTMTSMIGLLKDMMGDKKINELSSVAGGNVSDKDLAKLNRQLNKIKK